MANRGPLYGLSKDCQIKASKKFDIKQVREVLHWIESVLDRQIHSDIDSLYSERDAASVLKDGIALCELMNAISPGSIKRINRQRATFKQMENLEMFTKACVEYGLKQLDVFQIADLYEAKAVYTVFNCLHALGSLAQKNGYAGPLYGVRISEKKERHFSTEQIAKGKMIIPMQAGTNVTPSQAGMTPYGFSRQIVPSDTEQTIVPPSSTNVISLQYGTNSKGSQKGMTPYGLGRQITLSQSDDPVFDPTSISEQTGQDCDTILDRREDGETNGDDDIGDRNNGLEMNTEDEAFDKMKGEEVDVNDATKDNVKETENGDVNGIVGSVDSGGNCDENGDATIVNECNKKELNGEDGKSDCLEVNGV